MEAENKWLYPDTLKCNIACRVYGIGVFLQILYGISDVKLDGFDNNAWLETKKLLLKHVTQVELDFELACDLMVVVVTFHLN